MHLSILVLLTTTFPFTLLKCSVHGIPKETPTWVHLHSKLGNQDATTALIVDRSIKTKWAPGAEILITSHTMDWFGQQVGRISSIVDHLNEPGFVEIHLEKAIVPPTTYKESPDFAVEVALLSRNIVFEGGFDHNNNHGGHLVVFHTSKVSQVLEGVELRNFGQQGSLGRYPIHFHHCDKVDGSIVSKNTIRQSNQRCIVVHGTHNLLIQENIAFDTKGHCFMLEDGFESGNVFLRNLGALTAPPTTVIPNMGTNGEETDGCPATFWITSPSNVFIGNIAAGSADSGFWFEPLLRGDRASWFPNLDPRTVMLTTFKDNVAHSNEKVRTCSILMSELCY